MDRNMSAEEKSYRLMSATGGINIGFGAGIIAIGVTVGVLLIVTGAKLLSARRLLVF